MWKFLIPGVVFFPLVLMVVVVGAIGGAGNASATPADFGTSLPSVEAQNDIPSNYLKMYQRAGAQYGLDWAYLAGIGKIESNHGRSPAVGVQPPMTNFHGCCAGPMQFCVIDGCPKVGSQRLSVAQAQAGTWRGMGVDGNNDGVKNPWEPEDAIHAAAKYLSASGAPADWNKALWAYNHSETYRANVIAQADRYRAAFTAQKGPNRVADGAMRQAVIENPNIDFGPQNNHHESSIRDGYIDGRIVAVLDWIGKSHRVMITSMRVDRTRTGGNHPAGRAIDIGMVDGVVCRGLLMDPCGQLAIQLAQIQGPLHSTELIYCFDPDGPDNKGSTDDAWAAPDHCDHIHFGYDK